MSVLDAAHCPSWGAVSDWVRSAFNSTHLDESWTGPLHRPDQKVVPPQCTRSLVIAVLHPSPQPYDRDGADDGQEDDGQMEESKASCYGLVDVYVQKEVDVSPYSGQTMDGIGDCFPDLLPGCLEHMLFRCLAVAIVFLAQAHECGWRQQGPQYFSSPITS